MATERRLRATGGSDVPGWRVARALGGAFLRVLRAVPHYLWIDRTARTDPGEDTGEWPAPDPGGS